MRDDFSIDDRSDSVEIPPSLSHDLDRVISPSARNVKLYIHTFNERGSRHRQLSLDDQKQVDEPSHGPDHRRQSHILHGDRGLHIHNEAVHDGSYPQSFAGLLLCMRHGSHVELCANGWENNHC